MGKASKQAIVELIFLHMKLYPKLIEKKKKKKNKTYEHTPLYSLISDILRSCSKI